MISLLKLKNIRNFTAMASIPISCYFIILHFFICCFKSLTADPNPSFAFKNFGQNSSFDSVLAFYGDAKVVNGGSSLQITAGRVICRNPIKLYGGIPEKTASFSTYFSFSISTDSENGGGLAFVVFPYGYSVNSIDDNDSRILSVEFETNVNQIGINLSRFVSKTVANLSSLNLVLKNGDRLQVWIDYEAGSKRIEVRLSKLGENRPLDPLLIDHIDFPKNWPKKEVIFVGLTSYNGKNSSQICNVYSWGFKTRESQDWMHSQPLDPVLFKEGEEDKVKIDKKSDCVLRVLSALILGIGLGTLGSLVGMFLWMVFGSKECDMKKKEKEKGVVVDKGLANEKQ